MSYLYNITLLKFLYYINLSLISNIYKERLLIYPVAEINIKELRKIAYKCNKCDHIWFSRGDERPLTCPKCKTARWDKTQKNKKIKSFPK